MLICVDFAQVLCVSAAKAEAVPRSAFCMLSWLGFKLRPRAAAWITFGSFKMNAVLRDTGTYFFAIKWHWNLFLWLVIALFAGAGVRSEKLGSWAVRRRHLKIREMVSQSWPVIFKRTQGDATSNQFLVWEKRQKYYVFFKISTALRCHSENLILSSHECSATCSLTEHHSLLVSIATNLLKFH